MKKILISLLVVSLSISVFGYDIFSYVSINGNPKSYTSTEYSVATKFGDYFRTPIEKVTHELRTDGQETDVTAVSPRDVFISKVVSEYDAKGNRTSRAEINAEGEIEYKNVYTYKNGLLSDDSYYAKDNSLEEKTIYTYDNDLLVDETKYNGDGALSWKKIYKYSDGKLVTETLYFEDGSLNTEKTFKYTNTDAIESITINSTVNGQSQEVFRYSPNGQLNEITVYNGSNKVTQRIVIKYDAKGNVNKVSDYSVAEKFGTTVNELTYMYEYTFTY